MSEKIKLLALKQPWGLQVFPNYSDFANSLSFPVLSGLSERWEVQWQGKYFLMFCGLNIEKLLLEIHGQLKTVSGLPQFPNNSKLLITGARSITLNVLDKTSASCFDSGLFMCRI